MRVQGSDFKKDDLDAQTDRGASRVAAEVLKKVVQIVPNRDEDLDSPSGVKKVPRYR